MSPLLLIELGRLVRPPGAAPSPVRNREPGAAGRARLREHSSTIAYTPEPQIESLGRPFRSGLLLAVA